MDKVEEVTLKVRLKNLYREKAYLPLNVVPKLSKEFKTYDAKVIELAKQVGFTQYSTDKKASFVFNL